jgi:hypothetical protein
MFQQEAVPADLVHDLPHLVGHLFRRPDHVDAGALAAFLDQWRSVLPPPCCAKCASEVDSPLLVKAFRDDLRERVKKFNRNPDDIAFHGTSKKWRRWTSGESLATARMNRRPRAARFDRARFNQSWRDRKKACVPARPGRNERESIPLAARTKFRRAGLPVGSRSSSKCRSAADGR